MSDQAILSLKPIWLLGCGAGVGLLILAVLAVAIALFPGGKALVRSLARDCHLAGPVVERRVGVVFVVHNWPGRDRLALL